MATMTIPVKYLILDPEAGPEPTPVMGEGLEILLRVYYDFLGPAATIAVASDNVQITFPDAPAQRRKEALRAYERAVQLANQAKGREAAALFGQVLQALPEHPDARRNQAMALLEAGDVTEAKRLLFQALRLAPRDGWIHLLIGNIYGKHGDDLDQAEKWFRSAADLAPRDSMILNNIGAMLVEQGKTSEADDYFLRSIQSDPTQPNSYYALALSAYKAGDFSRSVATLDNMFDVVKGPNPRNQGLFDECRQLYLHASASLAREKAGVLMELVDERRRELEDIGGIPIDLEADKTLRESATAQMAWKHGRDRHIVRYQDEEPTAVPHLLMHELEHIAMEIEARAAGTNRHFASTAETREAGLTAVGDHIAKLQRRGLSDDLTAEWLQQALSIACIRLFNVPLDMIIEHNLYDRYEALRTTQFVSVYAMYAEALPTLKEPRLREMTPAKVFRPLISLDRAFALFLDSLFGARFDFGAPYRNESAGFGGPRIFSLWQRAMRNFQPGDEYRLVDDVAECLGMAGWYTWQEDRSPVRTAAEAPETGAPSGPTNKELLQQKEPAVMMYCLDVLQKLAERSDAEVFRIASEVALLGRSGLDYASPDQKYTLESYPGHFSGLYLLSLMYVAFQRVNPSLDLDLPFERPYQAALSMFRARSKD